MVSLKPALSLSKRSDVVKVDAGLRKIRHLADELFQVVGGGSRIGCKSGHVWSLARRLVYLGFHAATSTTATSVDGSGIGKPSLPLAPIFYVRLDGFAQKIFDFVDKPVPRLM